MSDIVERLRDPYRPQGELRPLCQEAAAEIERLRAALQEIVALQYDHESMTDVARIALKGS